MHCLRKTRESAGLNYYSTIVYGKKTLQEQVLDPEAAQIFCVATCNKCSTVYSGIEAIIPVQQPSYKLTWLHEIQFLFTQIYHCQCLPFIRTNFWPRATLGGRNVALLSKHFVLSRYYFYIIYVLCFLFLLSFYVNLSLVLVVVTLVLMFKVSHQFIFRNWLFGQSDQKRKNQLSCLFTFYWESKFLIGQ